MGTTSILKQWILEVTEVDSVSFWGDISDDLNILPVECVEIAMTEIQPQDRELIVPGIILEWTVGIHNDTKTPFSTICLKKMPIWTQNDIDLIKHKGQELHRRFSGNK